MCSTKLLVCLVVCLVLCSLTDNALAKKPKRSEKQSSSSDDSDKKLSDTKLSATAPKYEKNEEMVYELVDKLISKIHLLNRLLRAKIKEPNPQCPAPYGDKKFEKRADTFQPQQPPMGPSYPKPPAYGQPSYPPNTYQVNGQKPPSGFYPSIQGPAPPMPEPYKPTYRDSNVNNVQPSPVINYNMPQPSEPIRQFSEQVSMNSPNNQQPPPSYEYNRGPRPDQLPPQPQLQLPEPQPQPQHHHKHQHHQPQPQPQYNQPQYPQPQPQNPPHPLLPAISPPISQPDSQPVSEETSPNKPASNFNGKRTKPRKLRTKAVIGVNRNENDNKGAKMNKQTSKAKNKGAQRNKNDRDDKAQRERALFDRLINANHQNLPKYVREIYQLQKTKYPRLSLLQRKKKEAVDISPKSRKIVPDSPKQLAPHTSKRFVPPAEPREYQNPQEIRPAYAESGAFVTASFQPAESVNQRPIPNQPSHFQPNPNQYQPIQPPPDAVLESNTILTVYDQPPIQNHIYYAPDLNHLPSPPQTQIPNPYDPNVHQYNKPPPQPIPAPYQHYPQPQPNHISYGMKPQYPLLPPAQQSPPPFFNNRQQLQLPAPLALGQNQSPAKQNSSLPAPLVQNSALNVAKPVPQVLPTAAAQASEDDMEKHLEEYKRLIESLEKKRSSSSSLPADEDWDVDDEDEDDDDDWDEYAEDTRYSDMVSKKHRLPKTYKKYLDTLESSMSSKKQKKTDFRVENLNTNKNKFMEYLRQKAQALSSGKQSTLSKLSGTQESEAHPVDDNIKSLLDAIGYGNMVTAKRA